MAGVRVSSDKGLMALVVAVLVMCGGGLAAAETLVPAVYVFGDSTVDVGNNQYLSGNVLFPLPLPYGIDLPHHLRPNGTGRVSNGYNMADSFSRHLGFNMSPPAYLSLSLTPETNPEILSGFGGVNYASGDSGILNNTGVGKSLSMAQQVEFFAVTKSKMTEYAGGEAIDRRLSESLFLISSGGNDMFEFILSQSLFFYIRLQSNYRSHLDTLYDLGARRFGIIDVPPLGCVPAIRNVSLSGACNGTANLLASNFNRFWLGPMVANFAAARPGVTYSVGSAYNLLTNFTAGPVAAGFSEVARACCGGGRLGVDPWCALPGATLCDNRDDYLYWDAAHSTEATANRGAAHIFDDPVELGFAAPINFRQLVSDGFSSF